MKNFRAVLLSAWLSVVMLAVGAPSAFAVRTDISSVLPKSINGGTISADSADVTLSAVDIVNNNSVTLTGRQILLVQNSGASPYTFTMSSVADELGRTGDITYTMQAGDFSLFGPLTMRGWLQSDGKFYFTGNNAAVKVLIINLPNSIN